MDKEVLLKAASLCREAAQKLKAGDSPEKQASEIASTMVGKGLIPAGERERYTSYMLSNPEKIANIKESIASLPARFDAIGEVSPTPSSGGGSMDSMDKFAYQ